MAIFLIINNFLILVSRTCGSSRYRDMPDSCMKNEEDELVCKCSSWHCNNNTFYTSPSAPFSSTVTPETLPYHPLELWRRVGSTAQTMVNSASSFTTNLPLLVPLSFPITILNLFGILTI